MNYRYKRQIIFAAIYIIVALFISALMLKGNYEHNYARYPELTFDANGANLVSEKMSFPASNYMMNLYYTSDSDFTVVITDEEQFVVSEVANANPDGGALKLTYSLSKDTSNYQIVIENGEELGVKVNLVEAYADVYLDRDNNAKVIFTFIVLMAILAVILCALNNKINSKELVPMAVLFGFSIFATLPFLTDATMAGHDLGGLCGRIEGIKDAMCDGQIYPTIFPKAYNGYGYLGFMYPELFLLLPAYLRKLNVSMTVAYHILVFVINIATAYIGYYCLKSLLNSFTSDDTKVDRVRNISLCAAIFYLLAPYRLTDLYIRAALGEVMVMAFLPLIIVGLFNVLAGDRKKWYQLVIGLSGVLHSHILSCFMIIPMLLIITVFFIKQFIQDKRYKEALYALVTFFVINLWDIIPFVKYYLFGLNTDALTIVDTSFHAVPLSHLFAFGIGYDEDVMIRTIGPASLIVIIIFAVLGFEVIEAIINHEDYSCSKDHKFIHICGLSFVVYLLVSVDFIPWKWLCDKFGIVKTIIQTVQFPFRFLMFVSVFLMFMLAMALLKSSALSNYVAPIMVAVITLSVVSAGIIYDVYGVRYASLKSYSGGFIYNMTEEYLPEGTNKDIFSDTNVYIDNGEASYEKDGTTTIVTYNADSDTVISLPILYYPCYKAVDENGNAITILKNDDNRLILNAPKGEHVIKVRFKYL